MYGWDGLSTFLQESLGQINKYNRVGTQQYPYLYTDWCAREVLFIRYGCTNFIRGWQILKDPKTGNFFTSSLIPRIWFFFKSPLLYTCALSILINPLLIKVHHWGCDTGGFFLAHWVLPVCCPLP